MVSRILTPRSEISSLKIDQNASLDEYDELLDLTLGFPSLPKLPEWAKKIIAEIESLDLNYAPFLQFTSGLADGFFTEMDLEEFDTCYTGGAKALPYLKKAIKLFKAGHKARAIT